MKQVGRPLAAVVSRPGLTTRFLPATGVTEGPEMAGLTVPPMTAPTVFTCVLPVVARGASHAANCAKTVGLIDKASHLLAQTWWKVNCTQPPPDFSAFVTEF